MHGRHPVSGALPHLRRRARRGPALIVVLIVALLWQPLAVAFCAAHGGAAPAGARGGKVLLCTRDGYVERRSGPSAPLSMPAGHAAHCQSCCLPALDWLLSPTPSIASATPPAGPVAVPVLPSKGTLPGAACARGPPADLHS